MIIKIEIMQGMEDRRKDFACQIEVTQIGTGEMLTAIAVTRLVQRARITGKLGPLDAELSPGGKKSPIPGISRRQNAIEEVIAALDRTDQILRSSHSHEIAGTILRQNSGDKPGHLIQ